ncbi:MAG: 50S ribosomal protein L35 [bacterium]
MKLKTNKATLKRIKITGRKKILKRSTNQGHFNAKNSGNDTRNKRKDSLLPAKHAEAVRKQLPYNI